MVTDKTNNINKEACDFAEWLQENRWFSFINGKWHYSFEHGTSISNLVLKERFQKTTQALYLIFINSK